MSCPPPPPNFVLCLWRHRPSIPRMGARSLTHRHTWKSLRMLEEEGKEEGEEEGREGEGWGGGEHHFFPNTLTLFFHYVNLSQR